MLHRVIDRMRPQPVEHRPGVMVKKSSPMATNTASIAARRAAASGKPNGTANAQAGSGSAVAASSSLAKPPPITQRPELQRRAWRRIDKPRRKLRPQPLDTPTRRMALLRHRLGQYSRRFGRAQYGRGQTSQPCTCSSWNPPQVFIFQRDSHHLRPQCHVVARHAHAEVPLCRRPSDAVQPAHRARWTGSVALRSRHKDQAGALLQSL